MIGVRHRAILREGWHVGEHDVRLLGGVRQHLVDHDKQVELLECFLNTRPAWREHQWIVARYDERLDRPVQRTSDDGVEVGVVSFGLHAHVACAVDVSLGREYVER